MSVMVQYVTTSDGYCIAFTVTGQGYPVVLLPSWINHVQDVWTEGFSVGNLLRDLSERYKVVHYDSRGMGMSTRGLQDDFSLESYFLDLETVVERLNLRRFVLVGFSSFSLLAVHYALRYPERIDALILIGPPLRWVSNLREGLARHDWEGFLADHVSRAYSLDMGRRVLEMFKHWATEEDFLVSMRAWQGGSWDRLPQLGTPTLTLWSRGLRVDLESVTEFTRLLPDGRLVLLESGLPYGAPGEAIQAIEPFLDQLEIHSGAGTDSLDETADGLSEREVEVLRLIAKGKSNAEIAEHLTISRHTVVRHVSNILAKADVANRTEAATYAHQHGLA